MIRDDYDNARVSRRRSGGSSVYTVRREGSAQKRPRIGVRDTGSRLEFWAGQKLLGRTARCRREVAEMVVHLAAKYVQSPVERLVVPDAGGEAAGNWAIKALLHFGFRAAPAPSS